MFSLIRHPASLVWLILGIATIFSWSIGSDISTVEPDARQQASLILLVLAFVKARLIISHFMEVRHAPLALRLVCDAWVLGVGGATVGSYLFL